MTFDRLIELLPSPWNAVVLIAFALVALTERLVRLRELAAHERYEDAKQHRDAVLKVTPEHLHPAILAMPAPAPPPARKRRWLSMLLLLLLAGGTVAYTVATAQVRLAARRAAEDAALSAETDCSTCPKKCSCSASGGCKCPSRRPPMRRGLSLDDDVGDWESTTVLASTIEPFPERR